MWNLPRDEERTQDGTERCATTAKDVNTRNTSAERSSGKSDEEDRPDNNEIFSGVGQIPFYRTDSHHWKHQANSSRGTACGPFPVCSARAARTCSKEVDRGVPQGPVLGPILLDIGYNAELRAPLPACVSITCYADDTFFVVDGITTGSR